MRKVILIFLCIMFLAMAAFSGYQIYLSLSEYNQGTDTYDDLATLVTIPETPIPSLQPDTTPQETIVWPEVNFDELKAKNDDVLGWLYLEDTHVNYPVVQGEDNAYYLTRMFDGTPNGSGSIYLDFRNAPDFSDRHTIIYGHHMINDSMLSDITLYKKQDFYESHPYMLLVTPEVNYKLEVISGYVAALDYESWNLGFESDQEYQEWLDYTMQKSLIKSHVTPTVEDKVVSFSTCTYEFEEARYILVAVLRPYEKAPAETTADAPVTDTANTSEA